MALPDIIFYALSAVLIASAAMVVTARNPVHAVLFLILCFFNAAGLFVLMGAEFIAFILMIVYVGAVAVLFLFVVMMLDVKAETMKQTLRKHLPVGATVGLVLLTEMALIAATWQVDPVLLKSLAATTAGAASVENTKAIGLVLYTTFIYPFQVSGLILLVAMIGAIVLTLRDRKGVRRQNVQVQLNRHPDQVVKIRKVSVGEGVK